MKTPAETRLRTERLPLAAGRVQRTRQSIHVRAIFRETHCDSSGSQRRATPCASVLRPLLVLFSMLAFAYSAMSAPSSSPVTDLYPQSVIAEKSILCFSPLPKSGNPPLFPKAWFLKTYEANGRRAGSFIIHGIEDVRPSIAYSPISPSSAKSEPATQGFIWPAPVLADEGQFLTIAKSGNDGGGTFRIKKTDALALGFRVVPLGAFLEACDAHPELVRNVLGTPVAPEDPPPPRPLAKDDPTYNPDVLEDPAPIPILRPNPAQHIDAIRAPGLVVHRVPYPVEPFRPKILRMQPDETAPFVPIELDLREDTPQVKILARLPDSWFELELHYFYKGAGEQTGGKEVVLLDLTYRGFWRAPLDANGFPAMLLSLAKDEAALRALLDTAGAGDNGVALRWGFIDRTGAFVIPPEYEEAQSFSEELAIVRHAQKAKSGYIAPDGKLAIPNVAGVSAFHDGRARVAIKTAPNYDEVFIDRTGSVLEMPDVSLRRDFAHGFAPVHARSRVRGEESTWKYLRTDGSFFEMPDGDPLLRQATHFSQDSDGKLAAVCDYTGRLRFPPGGGGLTPDEAKTQMYEWKKHWRIIDGTGETVGSLKGRAVDFFDYRIERPGVFFDGLAFVQNDLGEGVTTTAFIDKTGAEVITPPDDAHSFRYDGFREDRAIITQKMKKAGALLHGFIDMKGRVVITPRYDAAMLFREGLAAVGRDGWFGYIDGDGREVIAPDFNMFYPSIDPATCDTDSPSFSEGLALVERRDGRLCYIDKTGAVVIELPESTVAARPFSEGRAAVAVLVQTDKK